MDQFKPFFQFLHKFVDLSEEEFIWYIKPYLQIRHFKKKQLIIKDGQVEEYMNYVLKGLVRKYYKKG